MKRAQKDRFEQGGWKIGTASELLGLTEAEAALVETKLRLGDAVRTLREKKHLSQVEGSSQSRVAKVENRVPEVSPEPGPAQAAAVPPAMAHRAALRLDDALPPPGHAL